MSPLSAARRLATRYLRGDDYARSDGHCKRAPAWLVLVANNFCNLHCKMCDVGLDESSSVFYRHLIGQDRRNMSLTMLETVLEQAAAFSPKPRIGLAYTEPLIHPQIIELCRCIVERGFFCSITTNGWTLSRLAGALVEIGVHEMTVSIDGPEIIHDRVRRKPGSFRKLYEGVDQLNQHRKTTGRPYPSVRFSYTLTDENYVHTLEFVREIEALKPLSINVSHLNFISDEMAAAHNAIHGGEFTVTRSNLGEIEPTNFDAESMWNSLEDLKSYVRSRFGSLDLLLVPDFPSPSALQVYYHNPSQFVGSRSCTDPWRMMMVKTDGTVIPAHGRCYDFPVGNLTRTPLAELWNNARFLEFRKLLKHAGGTLPACARCCGVIGKPLANGKQELLRS